MHVENSFKKVFLRTQTNETVYIATFNNTTLHCNTILIFILIIMKNRAILGLNIQIATNARHAYKLSILGKNKDRVKLNFIKINYIRAGNIMKHLKNHKLKTTFVFHLHS